MNCTLSSLTGRRTVVDVRTRAARRPQPRGRAHRRPRAGSPSTGADALSMRALARRLDVAPERALLARRQPRPTWSTSCSTTCSPASGPRAGSRPGGRHRDDHDQHLPDAGPRIPSWSRSTWPGKAPAARTRSRSARCSTRCSPGRSGRGPGCAPGADRARDRVRRVRRQPTPFCRPTCRSPRSARACSWLLAGMTKRPHPATE